MSESPSAHMASRIFIGHILNGISVVLLICAFCSTAIYTIFTYRYQFQSDAATAGMLAYEQIRSGQLMPEGWVYAQDFWPFFVLNPVTVLWPILHNTYLITQLSVLLQSAIVFFLSFQILKKVGSRTIRPIILALLFSGVSLVWSGFLWGQGQYGNVIMWIMLCIWLFFVFAESPCGWRRWSAFAGLFLVNGYINSTSVRYIPLFSASALLSLAFLLLSHKKSKHSPSIVLVLANLTASTLAGQAVYHVLVRRFPFFSGINSSYFIPYDHISKNLENLWEGLMYTIANNYSGVALVSMSGLFSAFHLVVMITLVILSMWCLVSLLRSADEGRSLLQRFLAIYIMTVNFVQIFVLLFTNAGSVNYIASSRYLSTGMFFLFFSVPMRYRNFRLQNWQRALMLCVAVPLVSYNCYSLNQPLRSGKPENSRIVDFLESENLKTGFASYWNADVLTVYSNYKLQIYHISLDTLTPYAFMSRESQYQREGDENFLLLQQSEYTETEKMVIAEKLGAPSRVLSYDQYIVLVYPFKFSEKVPNWYQDFAKYGLPQSATAAK